MNQVIPLNNEEKVGQGNLKTYAYGFFLSVALTLAAYLTVTHHLLANSLTVAVIIGLAIIQLGVQLFFFLHLGHESNPRWNLIVFLFALLIVTIVVGGTLWIMYNLNYSGMTPTEQNKYILQQEAIPAK